MSKQKNYYTKLHEKNVVHLFDETKHFYISKI